MNKRIQDIIFKKLYKELSKVEIIEKDNHIWFIDRATEYWYLSYSVEQESLYWRFGYFDNFFALFSLSEPEYKIIIGRWFEEILMHRISCMIPNDFPNSIPVEEMLKIKKTVRIHSVSSERIEKVLQPKVNVATSNVGLSSVTIDYILSKELK